MSFPWNNQSENPYHSLLNSKKAIYSQSIDSANKKIPVPQTINKEDFDRLINYDKEKQNFLNSSSTVPILRNNNQTNEENFNKSKRDIVLEQKRREKFKEHQLKYQDEGQMEYNNEYNTEYNNEINQNNQKLSEMNQNKNEERFENENNFYTPQKIGRRPSDQTTIIKKKYGDELKEQISMKQMERESAKLKEQLLENKLLTENAQKAWFGSPGSGAPMRDLYGNVITSRKKPMDPNIMSGDWYGSTPQIARIKSGQIPPIKTELKSAKIEENYNYQQMVPDDPIQDLNKLNRKERELEAQRENLQIMAAKQRTIDQEKYLKKQQDQLDLLKIEKEREELETRRMWEFGNQKLESKNLYETNFDMGKLFGKSSRLNASPQKTLREMSTMKFRPDQTMKSEKRPRTPVEYVERELKEIKEREEALKIQRKVMLEIPKEVSKTVQSTLDVEMQKVKNELNFQQNLLGEQILNLKGQIIQSDDLRSVQNREIQKLQQELQKTQLIDEIRQRELYMALIMKNRKPTIYSTITDKLEEPEKFNFQFPNRPRPYYNVFDPSIEDLDYRNRDLHEIINNKTELIPFNTFNEKNYYMKKLEENKTDYHQKNYGIKLENNEFPNLSDDFENLQGIKQPLIVEDENQVYFLDLYKTNNKRLEALEENNNPQMELEKLDNHLFHLLEQTAKGREDELIIGNDELLRKLNNPWKYDNSLLNYYD